MDSKDINGSKLRIKVTEAANSDQSGFGVVNVNKGFYDNFIANPLERKNAEKSSMLTSKKKG
jgi:hypothetical protein